MKVSKRGLKNVLKVVGWVCVAFASLMAAVLIATVKILTPERLTPLTLQAANKMLNADVSMSRVELSLRSSFPFLNLDADSLVIISRDIARLPAVARDTLPQWGDTLLAVDRLHGGINVFKLAAGVIDLKDLEIHRPKVNLLIVNDSLNNFAITYPSTEEDTTALKVPDIRLNRFSLIDPKPLRYSDIAQDTHVVATIKSAELTNSNGDSGNWIPRYHIDFSSNVSSPLLELLGQESMPIGLDGIVEWRHDLPYEVALKDFDFLVSKISGQINTRLNFDDKLTVESFDFSFNPIVVSELLELVPDSLAQEYYIPKEIVTDAKVNLSGALSQPYVLGSAELPLAQFSFALPQCYLKWDKLELKELEFDSDIYLCGGTLNDAKFRLNKGRLLGPGTELEIKGELTEIAGDPLFDGEIDGEIDISNLPEMLTKHLNATIKGKVTANTSLIVRPSMFSRAYFHKLRLAGEVKVDKFYYLADDTLSMYFLNHTDLHFGTNERLKNQRGEMKDSLLTATVKVDSADILVSGLDIRVNRLRLGVGAQNKQASTDTTLVIPMGGGLSVGSFSLFSITDSAGLRVRDINGRVSMQRYKDDAHLPLFNVNIGLGNLSAGNNHTRFMISKGALACSLAKLPESELTQSRREVRHIADSLQRRHPDIPVDSVYVLALEIRRRNHHPGHHRVHPEITASENEIIDWGTSSALSRLLLDWDIKGTLGANAARLFTPSFPVRNRVENFNIKFNNDSIALTDVKYKAGNSDFLISGNITNLKRAFTSKRRYSPLKIKFKILSDYIDVNELSQAFFTGSASSGAEIGNEYSDEHTLEANLDRHREERTDSVAPVLIPVNIDAELMVNANSVSYSDFVLNDFTGTVLMYDGALNLHDLKASSDVGSIDLTALYSAPKKTDVDFGFGMKLSDFNIKNFLKLVPAVDTIMPMLRDLSGIINANLALTSKIDEHMDLMLPTIKAAINLSGDSLSFIDQATFSKVAKWLLFRNKEKNMIDHVSAEMIVEDGEMRIYPFIFDFDRYRLGIQGYNDFDMNFNYHIAVLKSPIPFRFGINVKGNYDKLKIRLGRAKFNEKSSETRSPIVNDTRVNLINQFQNVFRRGVRNSGFANVNISDKPLAEEIDLEADTLTSADSAFFKAQGLIPE